MTESVTAQDVFANILPKVGDGGDYLQANCLLQ